MPFFHWKMGGLITEKLLYMDKCDNLKYTKDKRFKLFIPFIKKKNLNFFPVKNSNNFA